MARRSDTARTQLAPWGGHQRLRGSRGGFGPGEQPKAFTRRISRLAPWGGPTRARQSISGNVRLKRIKRKIRRQMHPAGFGTRFRGTRGGPAFLRNRFTPVMLLDRTDQSNNPVDFDTGFVAEPNRYDGFVGQGTVELPEGRLSLDEAGDAVTLLVRFWPFGNLAQPGVPVLTSPQQVLGLSGETGPASESDWSIRVDNPSAATPRLVLRRHTTGFEETLTSLTITGDPIMLVFVLENVAGSVAITVYVDGSSVGGFTEAISPAQLDLTDLRFGDIVNSDGSFSQVAIWRRALTTTEIASIGDNVNCPMLEPDPDGDDGGGNPDGETPLLDASGRSALNPTYTVDLTRRVAVLQSEPGRVERRRVNEYVPRRYELRWSQIAADELALIRSAYLQTRTAGFTRWNHPRDDIPSTPALATRWRIVGGLNLNRFAGGFLASLTITLEEVK